MLQDLALRMNLNGLPRKRQEALFMIMQHNPSPQLIQQVATSGYALLSMKQVPKSKSSNLTANGTSVNFQM